LRLQIHWQGHRLVVVVVDNGQGFDRAMLKSERNGLTNMSQRMIELGGDCIITSQPGKGCKVEFSIPLRRARRSLWSWLRNANPFSGTMNETTVVPANEPSQNHDPTKC